MRKYEFDSKNYNIKQASRSFSSWVWRILRWLVFFVFLTSVSYYFISLLIDTQEEKQIIKENTLYKNIYDNLIARQRINSQVIKYLQYRDNEIYSNIFHSQAPQLQDIDTLYSDYKIDTLGATYIINKTSSVADSLLKRSYEINHKFKQVFKYLADSNTVCPPLSSPIDSLNYVRVGACVGKKFSPFLKIEVVHNGLDLIAPLGSNVYAAGDGVVEDVQNQKKGLGNIIEIKHKDGYATKYGHLSSIIVKKGQKVTRGQVIGKVGASGLSFAPHLHFEVWKNDEVKNPVHYLFGSLTPSEYARVVYMSKKTRQSLD